MLKIYVKPTELFNYETNQFVDFKGGFLCLEHSLVSISKWESKWHKAFLDKSAKTESELADYIRCMTVGVPDDLEIYSALSQDNIDTIQKYIDDPMTATTISDRRKQSGGREKITAEIIYYWMISFNIPFECEKWHLNRLLTLIRVCDIKNGNAGQMSKKESLAFQKQLNAARKMSGRTRG